MQTVSIMNSVSVQDLKKNPSAVLRAAQADPVIVLDRQQPEALIVHLKESAILDAQGIRLALATALFREGTISLGRAARFSEVPLAEFIRHVSQLGIPVVDGTPASLNSQDGSHV